jgi:hypothetical protein
VPGTRSIFIKKLIEQAVEEVVQKQPGGFEKGDVMRELRKNAKLDAALRDINVKYNGDWQLGDMLLRQLNLMIGTALGARDDNGIRIYECYAVPGQRQRRWLPLRAMTRSMLRNVMRETRVQERQLHVKGEAYVFFMQELKKLGKRATVDQVYEIAAPKIVEHRSQRAA